MPQAIEGEASVEQRTRQIGRELLLRSQALAPSALNPRWWDEHVMQWSMSAPDLKGRLFRLVDVLPALPDRAAVLEHLKQYLGASDEEPAGLSAKPQAGRRGRDGRINKSTSSRSPLMSASFLARSRLVHLVPPLLGAGRSVRGQLSAAAVLWAVRRLARRFIAGGTAEQAAETILKLRAKRMTFSLDLLGEKVLSEREADEYAQRYLGLIDALTAAAKSWPDVAMDGGGLSSALTLAPSPRGRGITGDTRGRDSRGRDSRGRDSRGRLSSVSTPHSFSLPPLNRTQGERDIRNGRSPSVLPLDQADSGRALPRVNLSIKLTSLYSQFDPLAPRRSADAVLGRLRPILRSARKLGAFIHVDMEDYEVRDLTLSLFEQAAGEAEFADWRDLGIVVQAYLKDSAGDLERMIALGRRRGTPFAVRLVKGAYWDYENVIAAQRGWPTPVFARKAETDANFERLTRRLLAGGDALDPAVASHNVRSLAHAMAVAEQLDLPPGRLELQLLYGMGDSIKAALVERGQRVRVYAPFGELIPGMAYLIRRLLENTANESFLRQGFVEHQDIERLLADPAEATAFHETASGKQTSDVQQPVPPLPLREGAGGRVEPSGFEQPDPHPNPLPKREREFLNVPDSDFAKEEPRVQMQEAIERVRRRLGEEFELVIGGRRVKGAEIMPRENPARPAEVVARIHLADRAAADQAVAAAEAAQGPWGGRPVAERSELLEKLGDAIEANRYELAAWEVFETAKQWREADADVSEAVDYCRFYAGQAAEWLARPRRRDVPGESNAYRYLPRGVGAIIAPWNFPLAILVGMSTAAAAAGNAVILKPAEQSSAVAGRFMALTESAGFPAGVFNYLPGRGELIGDYLVRHPGVDFIAFTGSRAVGSAIYAAAAATTAGGGCATIAATAEGGLESATCRGPKHVVCEMGGKNAIIVDADADLDDAVRGVVLSAFGYNGQKCSACSRAIVVGGAYDSFLKRLIEAARSLTVGPPAESENFMGPLIDAAALANVRRYIEIGRAEARCALAGVVAQPPSAVNVAQPPSAVSAGDGYYVGPTIFADVPPTARIAQEEIFGPVLAVIRAGDFDEALRIANGTAYALTGGLYSRGPLNIERAKAEFRVGNLYLNRKITGALVDRQPFGGFKFSGLGSKAGGPDYLLQFVVPQTVTENTLRHGFAPESRVAKE